jgi:hypothetical protein
VQNKGVSEVTTVIDVTTKQVITEKGEVVSFKSDADAWRIVRKQYPGKSNHEVAKNVRLRLNNDEVGAFEWSAAEEVYQAYTHGHSASQGEELLKHFPELRAIAGDPSLDRDRKIIALSLTIADLRKKYFDASKSEAWSGKKPKAGEIIDAGDFINKDHIRAIYKDWLFNTKGFKLEKNEHSRLHHFAEALERDSGWAFKSDMTVEKGEDFPDWTEIQPFVVQHDWASAFKNAEEFNSEAPLMGLIGASRHGPNLGRIAADWKPPFNNCAFEFRISGKTVIVFSRVDQEDDETTIVWLLPWVCIDGVWIAPEDEANKLEPFILASQQVRAICVALDAEVATHDVVRQPFKLNKKRADNGKLPLFDYHVVSLAKKSRPSSLPTSHGTHRSPRMHFRRGHWRHFAGFRTWVRWTLAGNPDLGFIDKEYRL